MKKMSFFLVFLLLTAGISAAQDNVIDSPEGQQVVLGEHKRLTVFSDDTIAEGDPICIYLDSSPLEDKGYNLMEWYYLEKIDKHYIDIRKSTGKLRLPEYILDDEEDSTISVPLSGIRDGKGSFAAHGSNIHVTVTGEDSIKAELLRK